jgi:hypothetical protein
MGHSPHFRGEWPFFSLMTDIIVWFKTQLAENDVFAGFVGGSLMASVLYFARSLPLQLLNFIKWLYLRFFTVKVTINNADLTPFLLVANWLNGVVGDKWNSVQLDFAALATDESGESTLDNVAKLNRALTLGYGAFGFWYKGLYVRVSRVRDEEKGEERRKSETLTLRFFTRRREIIKDVLAASQIDSHPMVYVSTNWGGWRESHALLLRRLETIILPKTQKDRLINDLTWFFTNRDTYKKIGISCTRGYLFHGPPGTGKTTLARALAGHFKRDLYFVTLGDVASDGALLELISRVEKGGFVVFEDIDVVGAVTSRDEDKDETHGTKSKSTMTGAVTLGGLLQALDGVNAAAEHVVIMTTNRPELLDDALLRPGRLDVQERIDLLSRDLAEEMAIAYFGADYIPCLDTLEFPNSGATIEAALTTEHKLRNATH